MMKWAAMDPSRDEEPSLTLKNVMGTIIVMDLDKFEEFVRLHGLDPYKPNVITSTLSHLVNDFALKWQGVIIYGLDWKRGTEEAIIEIPFIHPNEVKEDLDKIYSTIKDLGASITIIAIYDYVSAKPARDRREAYYGTPSRARAIRLLRKFKRKGGDIVMVLG